MRRKGVLRFPYTFVCKGTGSTYDNQKKIKVPYGFPSGRSGVKFSICCIPFLTIILHGNTTNKQNLHIRI